MHDKVLALNNIMKVNSELFCNCLEGIDDETAGRRPNDHTNSMAFIAAHLVEARHFLASQLSVAAATPFDGMLSGAKTIDDVTDYPTMDAVGAAWDEISGKLASRFETITDEELDETSKPSFPGDDRTVLGAMAFLIQHEAYHIGQMALIRKFFEHEAISYDF